MKPKIDDRQLQNKNPHGKIWVPSLIQGIVTYVLGMTTIQLKRPHIFVDGGSSYPYSGTDVNINTFLPVRPLPFLNTYAPVLVAGFTTILSSIYLFFSRAGKTVKLWVKLIIIFFNVAWLLFAALISTTLLPAIEHTLYHGDNLYESSYYGVFYKNKEKKN